MNIVAPGKLILSGEHAVVYGKPALAMAINRYVTTRIQADDAGFFTFNFLDLSQEEKLTYSELNTLMHRLKAQYASFVKGQISMPDVLQQPMELALFALGQCLEHIKSKRGMQLVLSSTIPIGAGMGSSAATILSVMYAVIQQANVQVSSEILMNLSMQAEHIQHGKSSGLDLHVSYHGGCWYKKDNLISPRPLPNLPMYLVHTGVPKTTTGECVAAVANYFKQASLGQDFAQVTAMMDAALQQHAMNDFKIAIRENHDLLKKIGVVPVTVQQFIADIQSHQGAAKICGAGAVTGEQAGAVVAMIEDKVALENLCEKYGYTVSPLQGEARGVYVDV